MLGDTELDASLTLEVLAAKTTGFSGSDLRELCRSAAMVPVRECMREMAHDEEAIKKVGQEVSSAVRCSGSLIFAHPTPCSRSRDSPCVL